MNRILPVLLLTPAYAHFPAGAYGSFAAGAAHPMFGLDHVLAMAAVGLWAGRLGGRALWAIPATFVLAMLAGFGLALLHLPLPAVEPMILASVVVLGLLVATAVRLDPRLCFGLVALFAIFHGHAHGGEMGAAGAMTFALGFEAATALLHAAGAGLCMLATRLGHQAAPMLARGLGAATAVAGVALAIA